MFGERLATTLNTALRGKAAVGRPKSPDTQPILSPNDKPNDLASP